MSDTQKVKVTNWPFVGIWFIGWLFTMGYVPSEEAVSSWEIVWHLLYTYLVWPLVLGIELSG